MPSGGTFAVPESTPVTNAADHQSARRALRLACFATLGIVLAGLLAIPIANRLEYRMYSLFFEQFARIEALPLLLVAAFAIALLIALRRGTEAPAGQLEIRFSWTRVLLLAALVFVVVYVGIHAVFHGFIFTDDEYSAWFQAQIFARGRTTATVPPEWCRYIAALTPTSIGIGGAGCTWRLSFLPLHSLLNAPFIALGVGRMGGPLMAALSLVLVASIARKAWPDRPTRAMLAALFFATSTQVLFMSMTFFSMYTHLFVSLVWLWLFVDNRPWSVLALPWVGAVAMGVHSSYPHAAFALAYVARYAIERRFGVLLYIGVVYVCAFAAWPSYSSFSVGAASDAAFTAPAVVGHVVTSRLRIPLQELRLTPSLSLALMYAWNNPLTMIAVGAAVLAWRRLDAFGRYCAASLLVVLVLRLVVQPFPQGIGWGFRYVYDAIGSLCLLAAVGFEVLVDCLGRTRAAKYGMLAVAVTVLLQLPMRAWGVNSIVGPYRNAYEWMRSMPYDVAVYPWDRVMWGRQILRNDPFFRHRPLLAGQRELPAHSIDSLRARGLHVYVASDSALQAHGMALRPTAIGHLLIGAP